MSLTIKIKGSKGTRTTESEVTLPLRTIGIAEGSAANHVKNVVIQFMSRMVKEDLGSDAATFFASAGASITASAESAEMFSESASTSSTTTPATTESGWQDGKVKVKLFHERGDGKDLISMIDRM